jgi:hypothetical protein
MAQDFDRAAAKAAGYTDAEIDAYLASQRQAPTPRIASEATSATGSPFRRTPRPALTGGEEAKGLARSLASGATMGISKQVEPLLYALPGGESVEEARKRINQAQAKYRAGSPVLSNVAEIGGSLATGGSLLALARRGIAGRLPSLLLNPAVQGGVSGAMAPEGDLLAKERVATGLFGAGVGGALGAVANKATGALAERAARRVGTGKARPAPEIGMAEEMMGAARISPTEARSRAASMAADSPEARVVDLFGNAGVRMGRRIEAMGGEAGERINQAMGQRLGTKLERMAEIFPRLTGKAREDVLATVEESIVRGKTAADPLYDAFRNEAPKSNARLDRLLKTPFGKDVIERARRNAANQERVFIEPAVPAQGTGIMDATGREIMTPPKPAVYHPQSLDDIKKAMDDVIYGAKYQNVGTGTGGMSPGELRSLQGVRSNFVNEVDKMYPTTYAPARSAWAGESALRNAMEDAEDLAKRTVKPGEIKQYLTKLTSDSEREYFQRGWLNAQIDRIEAGSLTPKQIRTPLYEKQIAEVFGPDARGIMSALRTEVELADTAGKIIGGSRTAPLQGDMAQELGGKWMGRAREAYNLLRTDPMYGVFRAADVAAERLSGPTRAAARTRKAETLMQPAGDVGTLMDRIQQDYRYRTLGRNLGRVTGASVGAQTPAQLADLLRGGYRE